MHLRTLFPVALLAASVTAQTTHLVGPGGLPQIRDALAVAAPGDVILVQPGTYAQFSATVGVTIRAAVPGTVQITYSFAYFPPGCLPAICGPSEGRTVFAPPAGQSIHVVGLNFDATTFRVTPGIVVRPRVVVAGGTVTFDDCVLQAQDATALSVDAAIVQLQDCLVGVAGQSFGSTALRANGAAVTAVGCAFTGGAVFGPAAAGAGITLLNSTLKASFCQFQGGTGFGGISGAAIATDGASRLWVSDTALVANGNACALGGTPAVGEFARLTVLQPPTCQTIATTSVVGVERPAPIQNGSTFTVHVHTEPGMLVAIHGSPRLAHIEIPGVFAQPIALDLTAFFLAGVYVSDANGDVTASWNMPAGQYVDETVWLEASAWGPTLPVLVAPVVGGVIR